MEMYRHAMLMATSCGWFFHDIAGIESVQVLKDACRVMELLRDAGAEDPEPAFLATLAQAESNLPEYGNGAAVYARFVRPAVVDLPRAALHIAVRSLFPSLPADGAWYRFRVGGEAIERSSSGVGTLATGRFSLRSGLTDARGSFAFAAFLGPDQRPVAGVNPGRETPLDDLRKAYRDGDTETLERLLGERFLYRVSSWGDLLRDERQLLLQLLLDPSLQVFHCANERVAGDHAVLLQEIGEGGVRLSPAHEAWLGMVLSDRLAEMLQVQPPDAARISRIAAHLQRIPMEGNLIALNRAFATALSRMCTALSRNPDDRHLMDALIVLFAALDGLSLRPDLRESQTIIFALAKAHLPGMRRQAERGDAEARGRVDALLRIASRLGLRIDRERIYLQG